MQLLPTDTLSSLRDSMHNEYAGRLEDWTEMEMNWHPKTPAEAAQLLNEIEKRAVGARASSRTRAAEVGLNELALFAGAGGGLLASRLLGWNTVCAVEIDPYRQAVLLARQLDGCLPAFPIWPDVRTFDGRPWRGIVDVVTAGWPCPPISVAGKQLGCDDERWLWPEVVRLLRETGAEWFMGENPDGLLSANDGREFGIVLRDLARLGFDVRWAVLSAASLGAPHYRRRVWIVAHAKASRRRGVGPGRQLGQAEGLAAGCRGLVANANGDGHEGSALRLRQITGPERAGALPAMGHTDSARPSRLWHDRKRTGERFAWETGEVRIGANGKARIIEPGISLMAHGIPFRMDRIGASGDAQVPAVVRAAWELLGPELLAPEGKP